MFRHHKLNYAQTAFLVIEKTDIVPDGRRMRIQTTTKTSKRQSTLLMMRLLRFINMCPQLPLLIPQRRFLLPRHLLTPHDHHNRLIPLLLPIRRTARLRLILLALQRPILLPPLPTLLDRRHPLLVVLLRFLTRPKDIVLGDESVGGTVLRIQDLFAGFEGGEFAFGGGAAAGLNSFFGGL